MFILEPEEEVYDKMDYVYDVELPRGMPAATSHIVISAYIWGGKQVFRGNLTEFEAFCCKPEQD